MKIRMWTFLVLAIIFTSVRTAPPNRITTEDALEQLKQYGYTGKKNPVPAIAVLAEKNPDKALKLGLKMFQARNKLAVTGQLDEATQVLMETPRCGRPDIETPEDVERLKAQIVELDEYVPGNRRKKRYSIIRNSAWSAGQTLSYNFRNFTTTSTLNEAKIREEAAACMAMWSAVANINFQYVENVIAQLDSFFVAGAHLDGGAFDGPSGVLAHAYPPYTNSDFDGDMHMDAAENWSSGTSNGINFLQVFCHEAGHAIGILHSEVEGALMYPYYYGYQQNFALHPDDIAAARALYGSALGPTTVPPPPPAVPDFCTDFGLDAFTTHVEGGTRYQYAFKGHYYVRISASGIMAGYPKLIRDDWPGIATTVDAALYLPPYLNSPAYTLLFSGNRYFVYSADRTLQVDNGGRPLSSLSLPTQLSGVDSAFVVGLGKKTYVWLTKGNAYYKLSLPRQYRVNNLLKASKRAKSLSSILNNVPGDPNFLDAAANVADPVGSQVLLFDGNNYHDYNIASNVVTQSGSVVTDLYGCSAK